MSFNNSLSQIRYEQNKLDDRNEKNIELLCNSNEDNFIFLKEPKFIVNDGGVAVIINNGNTKFMCKIDERTGMIVVYHYSNGSNKKGKMRFHKHNREFYDWTFCLSSLNLSHTIYKKPIKKDKKHKSMWDKLEEYKNKR